MSHFTEVKTEMKDRDLLLRALKNLNLAHESSKDGCFVQGFMDEKISCDIRLSTGSKYDIGLSLGKDGCFEFKADWEMLKYEDLDVEKFKNKILQRYSYESVKLSLERQGYDIEEEIQQDDGTIQMVVSQW